MSEHGNLAKAVGADVFVAACDVFFREEDSARKCATKYHGTIEKLDDGWLVKIPVVPTSDDDPMIKAIKKALEEAGISN